MCAVVALAAIASISNANANEWVVVAERDGIVVSQRNRSEGLPAFRATTTIAATPFEILAVLRDDTRRVEWMSRCVDARLVKRFDRWNSQNYSRMTAWPFDDRDVVVATKVRLGPEAGGAIVELRSIDSEFVGAGGAIRMSEMNGRFRLDADGPESTRVRYELILDLGGRLPGVLARRAGRDAPLETLDKLRRHVPATRGDYAALVARWTEELPSLRLEALPTEEVDDNSPRAD